MRLATLLIAVLLAASARAADKPHPEQFLESGTVVAGTTYEKPFSTTTALVYGHWYRLVISGTWTLQWPADPDNGYEAGEEEDDPVYCVRKDPKTDGFPCTADYRSQTLGIKLGDSGDHYAGGYEVLLGCYEDPKHPASACVPGPPGEFPPPSANTSYEFTFQARHSGLLSFWDRYTAQYGYGDRGYPSSGSGSYGFQLFGMPAAPTKAKISVPAQTFKGRRFNLDVDCPGRCTVTLGGKAKIGANQYGAGSVTKSLDAGVVALTIPRATYRKLVRGLKAGRKVALRLVLRIRYADGRVTTSKLVVPLSGGSGAWSGTWSSDFGALALTQNGSRVTGSYPACNGTGTGTVEGTVSGRTLDGTWSQPCNGKGGRIQFVLSADGKSFTGLWSYGDATPTSRWNGTRA